MTRFARAKGSKSSNERAPEDSTPWEVMKEQLLQAKTQSEEAKKREEAEKQRIENYENFLREHKTQKRKATWCDFPESDQSKSRQSDMDPPSKKKSKLKQQAGNIVLTQPSEATGEANVSNITSKKAKKKKEKKQKSDVKNTHEILNVEPSNSANVSAEANVTEVSPKNKKFKNQKQKKQNSEVSLSQAKVSLNVEDIQVSHNKDKNNKNQKLNPEVRNPQERGYIKQNNKLSQNSNQQIKKKKDKKFVDGLPVRRKPINDHSFQLIINGKEVELVRFDGFPIMKKDADRLAELKSNMIKKGIPKSEVNRTLKLERRRAEKALARLKRDVCYNCRKGGHNLSDCPELKTKIPGIGAPDGVCFKCGSTEHRQFECKVQKDKEFRFATCFICKEPGHIARQCPDNPKGLYPNGGGCKLCGDVTHLRKDCPTMMGKKEDTSIKLQTLDSTDNLEGIEQKTSIIPQDTTKKPKKIKF